MPHVSLESHTSHIRHGIKTGLATVLAYACAQIAGLHYGYWAALSAVIVMQISVADSMQLCWYRLTGTAIGAAIGTAAILAFPETPPMTSLALFLAVALCAYMTRYDARYRMAAITACIVVLASLGQADRVAYGLERVLEIAIGVGSALVISLALWPQRAGDELRDRLRGQFLQSAELYQTILDAFLKRQSGLDPKLLDDFTPRVFANRNLLTKVLRHERMLYRDDVRTLGLKVDTLESCARSLRVMLQSLNDSFGEGHEIIMEPELRTLAKAGSKALAAIAADIPVDSDSLTNALKSAHNRLLQLREQGATRRFELHNLTQFFAFYHGLRYLARDLLRHAREGEATG